MSGRRALSFGYGRPARSDGLNRGRKEWLCSGATRRVVHGYIVQAAQRSVGFGHYSAKRRGLRNPFSVSGKTLAQPDKELKEHRAIVLRE